MAASTGGLDFTSIHSSSVDDGLDSLAANGEEPRGPRSKEALETPGRTYECEIWCRDASRQLAGCLGFTLLTLTFMALGAVMFVAIETRSSFSPLNSDSSSDHHEVASKTGSDAIVVVEPPTVMNVTAALLDLPVEVKSNVDKARTETVTKLWQVTERMNILYPENWTRVAAEEILWFQDQLTKALMVEFSAKSRTQASMQQQQYFYDHAHKRDGPYHAPLGEWTFGRGLLYSVSLLTTVGKSKMFLTDYAVTRLGRDPLFMITPWEGGRGLVYIASQNTFRLNGYNFPRLLFVRCWLALPNWVVKGSVAQKIR